MKDYRVKQKKKKILEMNCNLLILPNFHMGGNVQTLAGPPGGKSANCRGIVGGGKIYNIYVYSKTFLKHPFFIFKK